MKRYLEYLPYAAVVGILFTVIFGYGYTWEMVTGWREPQWAAEGLVMTNMNLKFLFAFIVAGGGTVWLVAKAVKRVVPRYGLSAMGPALISFMMIRDAVLLWGLPLLILLGVFTVLIVEKRKERSKCQSIS